MSIRSISTVETQRDEGNPPSRAGEADKPKSEALVEAIPTEILGPYTAIIAVVVANSKPGDWTELGRWILYGVCAVVVPAAVFLLWRSNKTEATSRKFPLAGMVAAAIAFGAWGLVMPGGPLTFTITGASNLTIATTGITVIAAAVIAFLPLNKQVLPLNKKVT